MKSPAKKWLSSFRRILGDCGNTTRLLNFQWNCDSCRNSILPSISTHWSTTSGRMNWINSNEVTNSIKKEKHSHHRKRKNTNQINTIKQRQRNYPHEIIRWGIDPRVKIGIVKDILSIYHVQYTVLNTSKSKIIIYQDWRRIQNSRIRTSNKKIIHNRILQLILRPAPILTSIIHLRFIKVNPIKNPHPTTTSIMKTISPSLSLLFLKSLPLLYIFLGRRFVKVIVTLVCFLSSSRLIAILKMWWITFLFPCGSSSRSEPLYPQSRQVLPTR